MRCRFGEATGRGHGSQQPAADQTGEADYRVAAGINSLTSHRPPVMMLPGLHAPTV